jgi:hypothetical protein
MKTSFLASVASLMDVDKPSQVAALASNYFSCDGRLTGCGPVVCGGPIDVSRGGGQQDDGQQADSQQATGQPKFSPLLLPRELVLN